MKIKKRTYSGQQTIAPSEREKKNRAIARKVADECVVLLKNNGILPLPEKATVALYGNGVEKPQKGGFGSGDVNCREIVGPLEGLKNAGFTILNEADCKKRIQACADAEQEWAEGIKEKISVGGSDMSIFGEVFGSQPAKQPDLPIVESEAKAADAVVYVLSRISGEGSDRRATAGDYYLSEKEKEDIEKLSAYSDRIIFVINTGAQIDLNGIYDQTQVAAILSLSQPGMELGNVLGDILSGKVTPSGKLSTTWAKRYEDFPNADTFGHRNNDLENEYYEEGIYIGYRYFDAFGVEPLYPFGYGLSYTDFSLKNPEVKVLDGNVEVSVEVFNIGEQYAGKEVVQVYVACPQGKNPKELKRLAGYAKTALLPALESERVSIRFDTKMIASYVYEKAAWVVEAGDYILLLGTSSASLTPIAVLQVEETAVIEEVAHILPLQDALTELMPDGTRLQTQYDAWRREASRVLHFVPQISFVSLPPMTQKEEELAREAKEIAARMSDDELIAMLMGEITKGQDNILENVPVETGIFVPGAAGETSCRFVEKYGIPAISLADGPAGLRLNRFYDVDNTSGKIYGQGIISAMMGGIFAKKYERENATTYRTYCTAIPVGAMLSCGWDDKLLYEIGEVIGEEMMEYGITWWLAPGMNIHRNPLCGRNFEYYSEDPLVSGKCAAAITNGVQSYPGVGTTIKHFACNNLEENRMFSNSIVSERALREIYLRGFEVAVKTSQPMCIMTSYNKINRVPAANAGDLANVVARGEWGFKGAVMTDWTTTTNGSALSHACALAGNDLIMPGHAKDVAEMQEALQKGLLNRKSMEDCAARLIRLIFLSNAICED